MAGWMLCGLTALACGLSCEGQASLSKSQIGLHENPLFASPCGGLRKYAILARRGNDILKLLRPVGLSKCTAFGHGVRTGSGFVEA